MLSSFCILGVIAFHTLHSFNGVVLFPLDDILRSLQIAAMPFSRISLIAALTTFLHVTTTFAQSPG